MPVEDTDQNDTLTDANSTIPLHIRGGAVLLPCITELYAEDLQFGLVLYVNGTATGMPYIDDRVSTAQAKSTSVEMRSAEGKLRVHGSFAEPRSRSG